MALNYQSSNPANKFTMLENEALFDLTPNEYYLYAVLRNLDPDVSNSNDVLMVHTGMKEYPYVQAKVGLQKKGWLAVKQLYGNKYAFYIGKEAVSKYKYIEKKSDENKAKKNADSQ
jgi:hypothetical protein